MNLINSMSLYEESEVYMQLKKLLELKSNFLIMKKSYELRVNKIITSDK